MVNFNHPEIPVTITAVFWRTEKQRIFLQKLKMPTVLKPGESFKTQIKINTQNLKAGDYNLALPPIVFWGMLYNSKFVKATVN